VSTIGRELLSGWGHTAPSAATVARPTDVAELVSLLDGGSGRGVIPRGLGRSYGDAAQLAGGTVVELGALSGAPRLDQASGRAVLPGGVSLHRVLREVVPRGWFVPVTPGTRQVTVGGAVAADVHGKNHHRDGAFGRHVTRLELATPVGLRSTGPDDDPPLFWATHGGMGLTGVVVSAEVQLLPVESAWMLVDTERAEHLDDLMAAMEEGDDRYRYSVAWVDCQARGRHLGRGVLTRGDHAPAAAVPRRRRGPLTVRAGEGLRLPVGAPSGLLNPLTVGAFNELWFRRAPKRETGRPQPYPAFFHPLDAVADWSRLYGPRGFMQYQFVVPPDRGDVVRQAVSELSARRLASFLAVLKRFGPADDGPLSFPIPGWTLALDLPVGPPGLGELLDHLDELVAGAGGRVYLAKDARLRPELLPVMYPRLAELDLVRRRVDPKGVLRSDLARRLHLGGPDGTPC